MLCAFRIFRSDDDLGEDVEEEGVADDEAAGSDSRGPTVNKSLVPTFVFPAKRRGFDEAFRAAHLMLEALAISEDFVVTGTIRVNESSLQGDGEDNRAGEDEEQAAEFAAGVVHTTDGWQTSIKSEAEPTDSSDRPALVDLRCRSFKFSVDCSTLDVGGALEFYVFCGKKKEDCDNPPDEHVDDNAKQYYKVSCTKRLNEWAAMAAKELKNYAPTVKYNKNYFE